MKLAFIDILNKVSDIVEDTKENLLTKFHPDFVNRFVDITNNKDVRLGDIYDFKIQQFTTTEENTEQIMDEHIPMTLKELEEENKMLKLQTKVISANQTFLEGCIIELVQEVYK